MVKNCDQQNPFCRLLDASTREQLCEQATVVNQEPKQIQLNQGAQQLEIIAKGVLVTFTILEDGSQKSIELVREGDILGTHLLSRNIDYPDYYTMALTHVQKCIFPLKVVRRLFDENRQFAQVLLQNISKRHAKNSIFWMTMYAKNSEEKVKYIYELLQNEHVDMTRITQEDLALLAGVSRISVARAMKCIGKNA
ncbi:MAG TPA: Crp/Fnr family transcriptional regulator [Clostridia bacterium]|nr:Crp/Fnr family transcriptional regulator [Clostridia bacterium]